MMVTNMKDFVTLDLVDADVDFRYGYRDTKMAQFKQDLYNKFFSLQDQDKRDNSLHKRIKFWLNYVVVNEGAPIPDNTHDYGYNEDRLSYVFQGAKNDPELRDLKEFLTIND